ncbi:phage tail tape measure protein [Mammaliicoccus sciuri]|uniref:phage tail tape measure protein n=1 Tax=Mammaliicoccus sciuri TaxID=1296 RepID=UPI002887F7C2|nr:phage tail tape measure protein [Mammaliicoccus sciuri]MDT0703904.1 phage tail tape measure protein [Mammaliicoccus sciuri]
MSNEKLQGLTLEMTLDAIGVQEGMKGLKRQLGVVNSEMKANLSAFDKSERSMKQYETRLQGLNNKLTVQKKMYGQAKQDLDDLNKSYQKAGIEVKKVESQLSKLTDEHKKNDQALKRSSDEIKRSNDNLKKARLQQKVVNDEKTKAKQKLDQLRQAEKQLRDSGKASTEQIKKASNATKQQRQAHQNLVEQYKKERATVKQLSDRHKELKGQNDKVKQSYKQSSAELKNTQNQHKKLNKEIQDYTKNQAEAVKKINGEKASLNNLERAIEKTSKEMKLFNREQALANSSFTKTAEKFDKMSDSFGKFGMGMQNVGRNMSMYVTTPIVGGFGLALKTSADFEQQMSRVGAIAEASGSQLKAMTDQAKKLGANTSKSASEVAKGMEELAALGFNANQVMKAMPGVISAAEASGADMATTATVMASSINAFGLEASDASHVADVLAMAANKSAADINDMGTSFQYAGAPANALGASLEETAAAIGVMRDSGIEASTAGTALRASFIRLANPTKKTQKAMDEMGIHLTDNEGKFVGISSLVGQFQKDLKGMSKEQKLASVATITGTEAASGFLAMIDAGPEKISKMTKSLENSDGASKKAADKMKDNLKGALEEMSGAFETLGIQIGQDLTPFITAAANQLQRLAEGFSNLPSWQRKAAIGFGIVAASFGPLLLGTGLLLRGIGSAMKGYAGLNRVMAKNSIEAGVNATAHTAAGTAMMTTNTKGAKASKGIGRLSNVFGLGTKNIKSFGGMLLKGVKSFGPWGLALTAVTTGLGIAYKKVDWFRNGVNGATEVIKTFSSGIGGTLLTSIKDLGNWVGDLGTKFMDTWEKSKQGKDATKDYEKLKSATKSVFDELSKGNKKATDTVNVLGKGVSKGTKKALGEYVKLSEGTIKEFEKVKINGGKINKETQNDLSTSIYQTGKEASKVVKERAQEIQNNLKEALSYSDSLSDEDKQNIIIRSKKAGKVKLDEVNALNAEINKLTIEAYQDGKISPEEQKLIQKKEEARNKLVIGYATKGEAERQAILSRMKYNAEGLSNKEISKALKEAYEIEEDEIKKAAEKRDKALQAANASLKDKSINKNEHRSLVLDIESEYNDAVDKAKKKSGEVRDTVKKGNKDISKEMDLSNGHVYTGAEKLWKNFVADFKKYWGSGTAINDTLNGWQKGFTNTINGWHDSYVKKASKIGYDIIDWIGRGLSSSYENSKQGLSNLGIKIWNPIKSGWNATTEWVSKKTGSAKDWLSGVKVKAGNLWQEVKTTTSDTFTKLTNQTKTKFGNMYKSSASWLGRTAGTALGKFTSISSGATKWLGKASGTAVGKFKTISKGAGDWLGRTAKTASGKFINISGNAKKWLGKTYITAKDKFTGVWTQGKSNFDKTANKVGVKTKSVYSNTSKWFGKTYSVTKDKFTGVWKQGKDKFTWTANKVGEKTKATYRSASKWFGNTYKNAKSNFTDMWGSARKNFNSISSHGWSKAKSTYKGFKSWLDRTLKYIRNIGSDMGRAAEDLGIKVANKAITGLNNMINGINKISTGITGESLIKPIDTIQSAGSIGKKLSTGTTSPSVSTDSEGGLKQATMAIVNDKGPGNGTGGFTQEIIERKDGSMYMPKGKDVPVLLKQGDKVHSGGVTQQLDRLGLLPRFHSGSNGKKRLDEKLFGAFGKLTGKTVSHGAEALDGIGTIADDVKGEVGKQVGKASAFVSKSVKDVWDFMEKPKELIKRVMGDFGVDFKGIPAHTGALVRGAYKKLKSSLADKVTSMFDEFGSSGGGYNPFANWPITPGRGWSSSGHAGIDYAVPGGTKIPSPIDGEVIQRWFSPFGGGNETQVYDGSKYTHIFMHQSKQIAKKGQRISQGDIIGLVGNTGNSFGDHLHWQVNRGKGFRNNHPDSINPLTWVKEAMANGGGSKNKGASAWRGDIIRAARQMGVSVTGSDISNIISLINAESSGNAGAVQSKSLFDINTLMGNPAQGLLQFIPQTFRHYAVKGHTNIRNGYDQLLAFFNNKNWRSQFNPNGGWSPSGPRRKYANGGISSTHKIAEISENNKAEAIVPLTKRTRAIQLTEQIMDYLGMDVMKPKVTVNNDTSVMEKLLKQLVVLNDRSNRQTDTIIQLIKQIPQGTDMKKLEPIISNLQGKRATKNSYTEGGRI